MPIDEDAKDGEPSPRFLKQDGTTYICEDMGGEALFDSIWEAQLTDDEVLVGFEIGDPDVFKSARVTKRALIDFAYQVLREYAPISETGTVGGGVVTIGPMRVKP